MAEHDANGGGDGAAVVAPSAESAPPTEVGHGSQVEPTGDDGSALALGDPPLVPLVEVATAKRRGPGRPKGSGKRKRKPLSARAKRDRERKAKKAEQELERELAAANAIATDAERETKPRAVDDAPAPVADPVDGTDNAFAPSALSDDDMRQIVGLCAYGVARIIPQQFGGGALSEQERELLGRAWYAYLRPYLAGEGGPLAVALGATVQVFALRAITAATQQQAALNVAQPRPASVSDEQPATPTRASESVSANPAKPARGKSAPAARGLAQPEGTEGRPARRPDPI